MRAFFSILLYFLVVVAWCQKDTVTLAAVGDIMMGTNYPSDYLPQGNGSYLWDDSRTLLRGADLAFGNLEGVILNEGGTAKRCSNPSACYVFRMPEQLASNLNDVGFDFLSTANNHANDFGPIGRKNTQKVLASMGISHAGAVEQPWVIRETAGLKVGMAAYSPNSGVMSIHDIASIRKTLNLLRDSCDIVIASFHGGAEGSKNQHVPRQKEYYYGEDRGDVYELAHLMIDNGADIVLGHGPHVVRAMELYKGRLIAYSLGNFLTYKRFNLKGAAGNAPLLTVKLTADGAFVSGRIHSFRQSYDHLGPRKDDAQGAYLTIKRLTEQDFPGSGLNFESNGTLKLASE